MYPNKNTGLGLLMASALFSNAMKDNPTTGRVFVVAKAALANSSEISALYGATYQDGAPVVYTTLALAVAKCVAARGDLILVAPGHTETISSATALNMSISGVSVVGLGRGAQRPAITLDTGTTSTITVSAAGVTFKNCIFIANYAAIVTLFTLTTANDFQLLNCDVRDTSAILNFLAVITTDTTSNDADGLVVDSCKIVSQTATAATAFIAPKGTNDRWTVQNNYYAAATTDAGAIIPIATGKILTNFLLLNNLINVTNATGTATGYIITTNGSTNSGFIHNNYDHALPTTPLTVTASSGFAYGLNYHSDAADKAGYLVPAADS